MLKTLCVGLAIAVGASMSIGEAAAAPTAIRCDTCDEGGFRAEAVSRGAGVYITYNLANNTVSQYYVGSSSGGGGGPTVPRRAGDASTAAAGPVVLRQTPPAAAIEEVRRGNRAYVEGGMTIRPTYVVPVNQLGLNADAAQKTAYDYVRDANLRAMVESSTGSIDTITKVVGAGFLNAVSDLIQMASNYTGLRDQARMMFRIVFQDGSYVTVIVNLENQNGNTEPGSARTPAGQLVPSDIQDVQGDWTNLGGEDLGRMNGHMANLGATMVPLGKISGSVIKGISCSGSGGSKICHVQYMAR